MPPKYSVCRLTAWRNQSGKGPGEVRALAGTPESREGAGRPEYGGEPCALFVTS